MPQTSDPWIDELEADLGLSARLTCIVNAGGQRRFIPKASDVDGSRLAQELGPEITYWLAGRFGGDQITFPSKNGATRERRAMELRAAVLEAGLTQPTRSANDIASEYGVGVRWIWDLRQSLREERGLTVPQQKTLFE